MVKGGNEVEDSTAAAVREEIKGLKDCMPLFKFG